MLESTIKSITKIAIEASLKAGGKILEVYNSDIEIFQKEDNSPLTEADRRGHEEIIQSLKETEIPILSEESDKGSYENRASWKRFWMVDPLDGTKEFIKRNGEFTINIALIEEGIPVWGVVYAPVLKSLYWGGLNQKGYKAENILPNSSFDFINQSKVLLAPKPVGNPFKVVASRSHLSAETEGFVNRLKEKFGEIEFVSMGSSLKICLVAEGKAQIYPRFAPTMEWDTAAGHAIALAAGCRMYNPENKTELEYNKVNLLNPWFIVEPKNGY